MLAALWVAIAVPFFAARPASAAAVPDQWQIDMLGARAAWKISTGAGVTVAVIDSGVAAHPPISTNIEGTPATKADQLSPPPCWVTPGRVGIPVAADQASSKTALVAPIELT